jgi:hypothetical protein
MEARQLLPQPMQPFCMTRRLGLATLAALLALLLSATIVPFVREWHDIHRTAWVDDPEHVGRVKLIAIAFPIYWFYVAAGSGAFLASLIVLRSGEGLRARTLFLFLILSDLFYVSVGVIGYEISQKLLAPDLDQLHYTHTLRHLSTYDRIWNWAELPIEGLLMGPLFGNIVTYGFGFLIGLPTVLWLAVRRVSTNGPRLRKAEGSNWSGCGP